MTVIDEFTFWRELKATGMTPEQIHYAWAEYHKVQRLKAEIDAKTAQVEEALMSVVQAAEDGLGKPMEGQGTGEAGTG